MTGNGNLTRQPNSPNRSGIPSPLPPNPHMIGRRDRYEEVVRHLLSGDRPIVVPGGPGMGKTTLALAVAHDKRISKAFGKARVFVNLEPVVSADAALHALAVALGIEEAGSVDRILEALGAHVAKQRTLVILDSLETPLHAEPVKTELMLSHLVGIPGLQLLITVRGETPRVPGGAVILDDVERLKAEDARALFLRESREHFATDPALPALLAALDGHPLSIVLMAAQTDGRADLAELAQDRETRQSEVLTRGQANDRLTSVRVSLRLSLDGLAPDTKRLLGLVVLLPGGLQHEDVATLLPAARADVARKLERSRLVEIRNERLVMLAPLREAARQEKLATHEDEARLIHHFLAIAADGNKIGTSVWPTVRDRVTREAGNLDAVCLLALGRLDAGAASPEHLDDALRGLGKLNAYGVPAEVASLQRARALGETEALLGLRANALKSLGDIALTAPTTTPPAPATRKRNHSSAAPATCSDKPTASGPGRHRAGPLRPRHRPRPLRGGKAPLRRSRRLPRTGQLYPEPRRHRARRSDHDTARARYEEAKPLYRARRRPARAGQLHPAPRRHRARALRPRHRPRPLRGGQAALRAASALCSDRPTASRASATSRSHAPTTTPPAPATRRPSPSTSASATSSDRPTASSASATSRWHAPTTIPLAPASRREAPLRACRRPPGRGQLHPAPRRHRVRTLRPRHRPRPL